MDRRQFQNSSLISFITLAAWARSAHAISLNDLSGADASTGLKAALEKGALSAVGLLGVADVFMGNDLVRIALPGYLNAAVWPRVKPRLGARVEKIGFDAHETVATPEGRQAFLSSVKFSSRSSGLLTSALKIKQQSASNPH